MVTFTEEVQYTVYRHRIYLGNLGIKYNKYYKHQYMNERISTLVDRQIQSGRDFMRVSIRAAGTGSVLSQSAPWPKLYLVLGRDWANIVPTPVQCIGGGGHWAPPAAASGKQVSGIMNIVQ